MIDLLRWGSVNLPDKQWFSGGARNSLEFILTHRKSAALGTVAAVGLGASICFAVLFARYEELAAAQQAAIMHTERANADLQDALARLRDQLGAANQALTNEQSRIAGLSDEVKKQLAASEQTASTKIDRIAQLTHALDQAQRDLHLVEAQRTTLMARFSKVEADLAEGQAHQQQAQSGLDQWQKKIQQLTADRDKAASERDHLRARLGEMERGAAPAQPAPRPAETRPEAAATPPARVAVVIPAPGAAPVAVPPAASAAPAPAPAAAAPAAAPTTAAVASGASAGGLAQFERVLASAGVDVAHLFSQFGVRRGEGGPFIPVRGQPADTTLSPEKLAALQALVKALPVSAPLEEYDIGSRFGVRGDPINGHAGYHTGIDLRAPYMSPVYATAPGVVTYSGYRDDYGKVVEIDHGNGISTRYAHLHRATVSVGQRVAGHSQIGFLGSTGRATGPHVHYEVLVNGEPQDPEKFLQLARLVPAVVRR